jgi:hypothetical protein
MRRRIPRRIPRLVHTHTRIYRCGTHTRIHTHAYPHTHTGGSGSPRCIPHVSMRGYMHMRRRIHAYEEEDTCI